MRRLKFARSYVFIAVLLVLITGCIGPAGPAVPTLTAEPPTVVVGTSTAAPDIEAQPGSAGAGDSLYPNLGNGGYDVQHYTLDLIVNDVATADLSGQTVIEARATETLSSLNFDFIGFEIKEITVNGQPA